MQVSRSTMSGARRCIAFIAPTPIRRGWEADPMRRRLRAPARNGARAKMVQGECRRSPPRAGPVARWKPDASVEILIARSPLRAASCSEARCGAARATADSREVNTRRDQSAPSARKARPAGLRADLVRVCCQLYLLARTVPGHPGGSVLCDRQE